MILQALKEYYDRKADDPESGIAPLGWEWKELPYLIVLKDDGSFSHIEDTQVMEGKKKRAKRFLVPQAVKRSSGIAANLLWDNAEYVTGIPCKGKAERVAEQHKAFLKRLDDMKQVSSVSKVIAFLGKPDFRELLQKDSAWKEIADSNAFISFLIADHETPVFREPALQEQLAVMDNTASNTRRCLITGLCDQIATLHPAIKGVQGTNTTGGNIVSFNFDAACSFGKKQGDNAPIGEQAAFKYTTALNSLLAKESRQKMVIGDATTVFWATRPCHLEEAFVDLFGEPEKDNPDKGVKAVEALFASVQTGVPYVDAEDNRFYVLGLSPNSARVSVRFWHIGTVQEMEGRFRDWFENLRIVHGPNDREHLSLWRLLLSLAVQSKTDNIPPNLAGDIMRSILDATPYPATLLSSALLRIKAEHDVTYPRSKLIKAFLIHNLKRSITVSLDKENTSIGYRLGRLFATLERIQQAANPGINATIRDRFYASASSTPATVFGNLMRLKNHHLAKLESAKQLTFYEKLLGEIIYQDANKPGIAAFPAHLSLEEQGQFAIGYYHQKQDFFVKKEDGTSISSDNNEAK